MFSSKVGIINIPKFTKSLWKNQIPKNSFVRQASSGQSADQLKEFKDDTADYLGETKTSAAMIAYLKRAQAHTEFIEKHSHEFQVGRRHLANIMGRDPETFTQEDIDESIEYLFPSGLFEPLARPMMKPPETIFAAKKEAEFDESGKPFHWLFYTTYPNFFELLHNVVGKMKELNRFEDEQIRKGLTPPENSAVSMGGMEWLPKKLLDKKLLEEIPEDAYKQFLALMDRFIQHPYAYLAADTYEPVRKSLLDKRKQIVELEPQFTEDGRTYITTTDNTKRPAVAKVTVYNPGTGKFTVNGEDLLYFKDVQSREQYSQKSSVHDTHNQSVTPRAVSPGCTRIVSPVVTHTNMH
nr:PREDICTED: 28S ribosomal protein S9, mitochondrial [Bemisia tabaci]